MQFEDLKKETFDLLDEVKDKLSEYQISQGSGVSASSLANWRDGTSSPRYSSLAKVRSYLLDFKNEKARTLKADALKTTISEAIDNNMLSEFALVPLVPIRARAGYLTEYRNEEYIDSLPFLPIATDREYKGKYMIFEAEGDSMNDGTTDSILDGDKLLCRNISKEYWSYKLHYRDWFFIIVHETEGIIIKQIVNHDVETGYITCHSLNPYYGEDFKIRLNDVKEIYNVIQLVNRHLRK